jgi:hypothetical protein
LTPPSGDEASVSEQVEGGGEGAPRKKARKKWAQLPGAWEPREEARAWD